MKIIRFEASNVLKIKAVEIQPDGSVMYYIGGKNKAGKSSVLTAIEMCLAGANAIPPEPLRKGAKRGKAVLDLGDIIVERRFTPSGTTLIVKNADGTEVKSPQKLLDTLIGRISFDPSEFARMEPKEQLATLQRIVGLDFKPLDEKRSKLFTARTEINRRVKEVEARLKIAVQYPDAPTEEVKVADLMNEMKARQAHNAENDLARTKVRHQADVVLQAQSELESADTILAECLKAVENAKDEVAACHKAKAEAIALQEQMEAAVVLLADQNVAEVEAKIKAADETNRKVRANFSRKQEQDALRAVQKEAEKLTEQIDEIDEAKQESLAAAKFPIEGLGFNEQGVTFNGLPFEQCSSAESIEVSMAIGLAINPKLPVVLIKHGSLIDDEQLEIVRKLAEAHEPPAQVIVERVGEGQECSVIIEDGHIKGEEQPEEEPQTAESEPVGAVEGSGEGP